MLKLKDNVIRLKKYFGLVGEHREIPRAKLLSTNESLKNFGRAWNGNNGGDVAMMLAVAEHEYMSDNSYNEDEMNAVKYALSRVAKFMKECGKEWQEHENKQAAKAMKK
jgi:hypothetical protein